jgi:small neutral amino acid transporter SnatA (MarC family)
MLTGRNGGLGMDNENLVRDSLIVFAMVVLSAYAIASALNLVVGATPSNQVAGSIVLVVVAFLMVLGLGFVLWKSEAGPLRT